MTQFELVYNLSNNGASTKKHEATSTLATGAGTKQKPNMFNVNLGSVKRSSNESMPKQ